MAARAIIVLALLVPVSLGARMKATRSCTLTGEGVDADITTSPTNVPASGGKWSFSGAGKVKVANEACPISANDPLPPADQTITHGEASDVSEVECTGACCISYCCGTGECLSTFLLKAAQNATAAQRTDICLASELHVKLSSAAGGSGGQGAWENVAEAGEDDCISTTHGVALKLCGPGEVSAYSSPNCAGSAETISHGTGKTAADCSEVTGNIVSIKYSCHAGNR